MGDSNVFNTFSFNKWAEEKKEEEIDKESRRRRALQMKRLKERLARERQLREAGRDGDLDLDALIEALQRGDELLGENISLTAEGEDGEDGSDGEEQRDNYILEEIRRYDMQTSGFPKGSTVEPSNFLNVPDKRLFQYNRRLADLEPKEISKIQNKPKEEAPKKKVENVNFKYNRPMKK